MKPEISVIVSTYNSPAWLEKVIVGYQQQLFKNFELIIADDGSSSETVDLIEKYKEVAFFEIIHVWHEDKGFRKTEILNKAILKASAAYLLFTDGDCIPRNDFLEVHVEEREQGCFLSGGYFKLPMNISQLISVEDIIAQHCFDISWLLEQGLKTSIKNLKISSKGKRAQLLNRITPTKPTWNGHNASGWKKDILAANGFDMRMQYGGEDRELGERLFNRGVVSKQIRYSAICVHLDHKRGYVKPEMIEKNKAIRKETKDKKLQVTTFGIEQLEA